LESESIDKDEEEGKCLLSNEVTTTTAEELYSTAPGMAHAEKKTTTSRHQVQLEKHASISLILLQNGALLWHI